LAGNNPLERLIVSDAVNLSPVHTSNNVEATGNFVATNGNNVERVYRKVLSFRQSRMLLRQSRT